MHKFSAFIFSFLLACGINSAVFAKTVTVCGECVGVKLYTDGLIITDTSELTLTDGKKVNIASGYGIRKGDIIKEINGRKVTGTDIISEEIKKGDSTLLISRDGRDFEITLSPAITRDGAKLGFWLRDSTAGLGTVTCIDNERFYGLGHGICDIDTGNIMPVRTGVIQNCSRFCIIKGKKGTPGAITGNIDGTILGNITDNGTHGICGSVSHPFDGIDMETAQTSEITVGDASVLCDVDGNGVKEYSVRIKQIYPSRQNGKNMIIKVTDKDLISKTGGIVQGMSGAPVIQNGKLAGAVTHVFVNDPTKGYGIFIENMLEETKNFSE